MSQQSELCVFRAWLRLRTFLISGDNMSTAFLCGNIEEDYFSHYDVTKFINIINSIIDENGITKIYHCRRTFFDTKICELLWFFRKDIEIVEIRDIHKNDFDYKTRQNNRAYMFICPFETEIENSKLYQTLYDYAIDNSNILIAYSKFDDDISKQIIRRANEKRKTVINIAEMI